MKRLSNFIEGSFVEPSSKSYLEKLSPLTGEVIYELPDSTEVDMVRAIQSAGKAFDRWSRLPYKKRASYLLKIADLIEEKREDFILKEVEDLGKPRALFETSDLVRAVDTLRFYAASVSFMKEESLRTEDLFGFTNRIPLGVVGLIIPWNFPLSILIKKLAPALIMGNACVCKPSELTSHTAYLLGELFQKADLPKGVCNVVLGKGEKVGEILVKHPTVKGISFTGGTETGSKIMKSASYFHKKLSLELGGKNPFIILKDADLKKALSTSIKASFLNSGQVCLSSSRIFVQEDIYEDFLKLFTEKMKEIKVGSPFVEENFMGPLISKEQKEKTLQAVDQAKKEKGDIISGTLQLKKEENGGYYLPPFAVLDLNECSELWHEEIFGPITFISSFKHPQEAIKRANNTPYGLGASLWTQDITKAHRLIPQIHSGVIWVNSWMKRDKRLPFGGMKSSGVGREEGQSSIDFFSERQTVWIGQ